MSRAIRIKAGAIDLEADLNDSATASAIWDTLPIQARANTWGDEIYFAIPVQMDEDNAQETVNLGDLGYWPPGNAFCIFYGQTPASLHPGEIRPASPVNVVGNIRGDATIFKKIRSGEIVTLSREEA
jgi:uncharacterized protein